MTNYRDTIVLDVAAHAVETNARDAGLLGGAKVSLAEGAEILRTFLKEYRESGRPVPSRIVQSVGEAAETTAAAQGIRPEEQSHRPGLRKNNVFQLVLKR